MRSTSNNQFTSYSRGEYMGPGERKYSPLRKEGEQVKSSQQQQQTSNADDKKVQFAPESKEESKTQDKK